MPEIKSLNKAVSDSVIFYPYKEISDEDWPKYYKDGQWVEEDKGWREVGFRTPWPTPSRLNKLSKMAYDVEYHGDAARVITGEYAKFCKTLTHQLIQDVLGLTDNGAAVDYKKPEMREWLYNEFLKSNFLSGKFFTFYTGIGGKIEKDQKADKENFFDPLDNILKDSSKDTASNSMETSDDSLPNLSDEE